MASAKLRFALEGVTWLALDHMVQLLFPLEVRLCSACAQLLYHLLQLPLLYVCLLFDTILLVICCCSNLDFWGCSEIERKMEEVAYKVISIR